MLLAEIINVYSGSIMKLQELEECHTLCHGNWIEIEHKYKYIQELRHLLDEHGIPYPEEYEID